MQSVAVCSKLVLEQSNNGKRREVLSKLNRVMRFVDVGVGAVAKP